MQDQCLAGAELVVNINGSPFHAGKSQQREQMLATRAADNAVLTLYCNLVGGQDHLIFDGGSTVYAPGGDLIARAPMFREHLLTVDLDVEDVRQTRLHDPRLRRLPQTQADVAAVSQGLASDRGPLLGARIAEALPNDEAGLRSAGAGHARLRTQDRLQRRGDRAVRRDRLDPDGGDRRRRAGRGARARRLDGRRATRRKAASPTRARWPTTSASRWMSCRLRGRTSPISIRWRRCLRVCRRT